MMTSYFLINYLKVGQTINSSLIFINIKIIMQSTASFGGLSLTEIFEIQAIQTLLIKFWYLGLTSDCLVAK